MEKNKKPPFEKCPWCGVWFTSRGLIVHKSNYCKKKKK